jgi:ankyrin repeat protein
MDVTKSMFTLVKARDWDRLMERLIADGKKANINAKDEQGNTLLMHVVVMNQEKLIDQLLLLGANIDGLDREGRSILHHPIKFGLDRVVDMLLTHPSTKKIIGIPLVDLRDGDGNTPLHYAGMFSNTHAAKLLLAEGANPNPHNHQHETPLHLTMSSKLVSILLTAGAHPNVLDATGLAPLHYAALRRRADVIRELLSHPSTDVNVRSMDQELTPAMHVLDPKHRALLDMLLDKGADLTAQDAYGNSMFHQCITDGYPETFDYLVAKYQGKCPEAWDMVNVYGMTPLHLALAAGDRTNYPLHELVRCTDLNIQDQDGNTTLFYLAQSGAWKDFQDVLLPKVLDAFIVNHRGQAPFDVAKDRDAFLDLLVKSMIKDPKADKKILTDAKRRIVEERVSVAGEVNGYCVSFKVDQTIRFNTFLGISLDVLAGCLLLAKEKGVVTLVHPRMFDASNTLDHFKSLHTKRRYTATDLYDIEILWSYQKIYIPPTLALAIKRHLAGPARFLVVPLGIELTKGGHANMLIIDKQTRTIERFEPSGRDNPIGFYYNPKFLDDQLKEKLMPFYPDYRYLMPSDYMPKIGFQLFDAAEESKIVGDPDGFCTTWCAWYAMQRATYPDLDQGKLVRRLVISVKRSGVRFRDLIRSYGKQIGDLRDSILTTLGMDLNDWINARISPEQQAMFIKHALDMSGLERQ